MCVMVESFWYYFIVMNANVNTQWESALIKCSNSASNWIEPFPRICDPVWTKPLIKQVSLIIPFLTPHLTVCQLLFLPNKHASSMASFGIVLSFLYMAIIPHRSKINAPRDLFFFFRITCWKINQNDLTLKKRSKELFEKPVPSVVWSLSCDWMLCSKLRRLEPT